MCPSGRTSSWESARVSSDFRPAFELLDVDRDGKISLDDLRKFYSGYASGASDEDIGSMILVADSNKDGFVEYEEFERVLVPFQSQSQSQPPRDNSVMEDMFTVMDRDGDGKVGFDDLKSYMKWAGFQADDEDIRAMIRLGGGDDHDGISCESLFKVLALDLVGQ
ncbi:hypothetical protein NE237_011328 [Protea cynaroides]|uniref:EF-hand domain-containing protein n=1 Tax=Protea cynaroides TaxID=273540 RepID=A0A9Q0JXU4_9MAGN|nr:hypothetical protein NE237_011328 [Protea cynaroides]